MSENEHRRMRDLSQYDSMPMEALEQILRADAETPTEQESDIEQILYVMEVLVRREKDNQQSRKTAQQSWESFQQHYLAESEIQEHRKLPGQPWGRRMVACAAAVILILCIPMSSRAFSFEELWNVVARWAKETFSFVSGDAEQVSEPEITDSIEYTSLQNLLKQNNRPYDMIPTWIPDGFVLEKVEKDMMPGREVYRAFYLDGIEELTIRVQTYTAKYSENIEIEDDPIEIYELSGISYYIFSNLDQYQIMWIAKNYECMISGDISFDEAIAIVNSIGGDKNDY